MAFEELSMIQERLNNPHIGHKEPKYTKMDLKRTGKVFLSHQTHDDANEHTQSWWEDYSPLHFDYTRYLLNAEREIKTKEFRYPQENLVEEVVFPFFNNNLVLKSYVENEANQHNFSCLARTEVNTRIYEAGYVPELSNDNKTSLEFRKNLDDSISVFEKFYLPKRLMRIEDAKILESQYDSIASVVMESRITEHQGKINHTISAFLIQPIDEKVCDLLFQHPALSELKKYFYNETALNIEFAEEDEWLLINPADEPRENKESEEAVLRQRNRM